MRAVSLLHRLPLAHFNLGVALARSGEKERANIAFETALRFQPEMINAHRYLATIHNQEGGDPEKRSSIAAKFCARTRVAPSVPATPPIGSTSFSIFPKFRNAKNDRKFFCGSGQIRKRKAKIG